MEAQSLKNHFLEEEIFLPSHCVNPQEINPSGTEILPRYQPMEDYTSFKDDSIKLDMEEFRDLLPYLPEPQPPSTSELNTPIFCEENPFDFATQKSSIVTEKPFELDCSHIEINKDSVLASQLNKDIYIIQQQQQQQQQNNNNSEIVINYLQQQQNSISPSETPIVLNDDQISCASFIEDSVLGDKYSNVSSPSEEYSNTNDMENFSNTLKDDQYSNSTMSSDHSIKKERPKLHLNLGFNSIDPTVNTPDVINSVISMDDNFNILEFVDDKDIRTVKIEDILPSEPTTSVNRIKRQRQSYEDEEYVYNEESDSDEDYLPKKKKRGRPPKRRISVNSESSDASKYRELRDKNNEASRKSRLKRKIKEKCYEEEADILHKENIKLKAQVSELERMVNSFRSNLFQLMLSKK